MEKLNDALRGFGSRSQEAGQFPFTLDEMTSREGLREPGTGKEIRLVTISNASCEPIDRADPYIRNKEGVPIKLNTKSSNGGVASAMRQITSVVKCLISPDANPLDTASRRDFLTKEEVELIKEKYPNLFNNTDIILVPISKNERDGYYIDVSNGHYWPAFHNLLRNLPDNAPSLEARELYHMVNRRMADYLIAEAKRGTERGTSDIIWVHDYQLAEVPMMVREALPDAKIGYFLHIPFANPHDFISSMGEPQARGVIEGVLGADMIGVHVTEYKENFLECCRELGYYVSSNDFGLCVLVPEGKGLTRQVSVMAAPISVAPDSIRKVVDFDPKKDSDPKGNIEDAIKTAIEWRQNFGDLIVLFGAERLDYSKGILERLNAIKYILENPERYPGAAGSFVLDQHVVPSRTDVPRYQLLSEAVDVKVREINAIAREKYWREFPGWTPVRYSGKLPPEAVYTHAAAADGVIVNPEKDGLNLVIKEATLAKYFAYKAIAEGRHNAFLDIVAKSGSALILSTGTGAAKEFEGHELGSKLNMVDGRNIEETADAIYSGLGLGLSRKLEKGQQASSLEQLREVQIRNVEALGYHCINHNLSKWVLSNINGIWNASSVRRNQVGASKLVAEGVSMNTMYGRLLAQKNTMSLERYAQNVNGSIIVRQDVERKHIMRALWPSRGEITWCLSLEQRQELDAPLLRDQLLTILTSTNDRVCVIRRDDANEDAFMQSLLSKAEGVKDRIEIRTCKVESKERREVIEKFARSISYSTFEVKYPGADWNLPRDESGDNQILGEMTFSFERYGQGMRSYLRNQGIENAIKEIKDIARAVKYVGCVVSRNGDFVTAVPAENAPERVVADLKKLGNTVVYLGDQLDETQAFKAADYGIYIGHSKNNPNTSFGLTNTFNLLTWGDFGPFVNWYVEKCKK